MYTTSEDFKSDEQSASTNQIPGIKRVKGLDFHPTEPWIAGSTWGGIVYIWNYVDKSIVKYLKVSHCPVRAVKFIPRMNWVVVGCDDFTIYIFHLETMRVIKILEGHLDYVREIVVHPVHPWLISCSDDQTIRVWNWETGKMEFMLTGHSHYVMSIALDPTNDMLLASTSLDITIRVWDLQLKKQRHMIWAHERGINKVTYLMLDNQVFLCSCGDDRKVKLWKELPPRDQGASVLNGVTVVSHSAELKKKTARSFEEISLRFHENNVNGAVLHPSLPILLSVSEDKNVLIYKIENLAHCGKQDVLHINTKSRIWTIACSKDLVAIGTDDGAFLLNVITEGDKYALKAQHLPPTAEQSARIPQICLTHFKPNMPMKFNLPLIALSSKYHNGYEETYNPNMQDKMSEGEFKKYMNDINQIWRENRPRVFSIFQRRFWLAFSAFFLVIFFIVVLTPKSKRKLGYALLIFFACLISSLGTILFIIERQNKKLVKTFALTQPVIERINSTITERGFEFFSLSPSKLFLAYTGEYSLPIEFASDHAEQLRFLQMADKLDATLEKAKKEKRQEPATEKTPLLDEIVIHSD